MFFCRDAILALVYIQLWSRKGLDMHALCSRRSVCFVHRKAVVCFEKSCIEFQGVMNLAPTLSGRHRLSEPTLHSIRSVSARLVYDVACVDVPSASNTASIRDGI